MNFIIFRDFSRSFSKMFSIYFGILLNFKIKIINFIPRADMAADMVGDNTQF